MQAPERDMQQVKVVTLKSSRGSTPLFCFPGAGGEVRIFQQIALLIEADQPVYGIDARDFFDTDREFSVEALADLCFSIMRERQRTGPYLMCGYSFGALVAYEVATRLRRLDENVRVVALIDTGNPAFRTKLSRAETQKLNKSYLANRLVKYARTLADGDVRAFLTGILAVFAARIDVRTRRLIRSIFLAMNRPMPGILRHNDRAMFDAWRKYDPPAGALPLLLFYEADRPAEYDSDPTLGWGLCTSSEVHVESVSGGHVGLMTLPHVRAFAARLDRYMERKQ